MALITQEPLRKIKEQEVTLLIPEEVLKEINEYCRIAGISRGYERNGEAKTSIQARQEYWIVEAIKRVLEQDRTELEGLKGSIVEDVGTEEVAGVVTMKPILSEGFEELLEGLQ